MAQTLALYNILEETETSHPQELGIVDKGIWRTLTVILDLIAQQEAKPGISLHPPTAPTSTYCSMLWNAPSSVVPYLLIYSS